MKEARPGLTNADLLKYDADSTKPATPQKRGRHVTTVVAQRLRATSCLCEEKASGPCTPAWQRVCTGRRVVSHAESDHSGQTYSYNMVRHRCLLFIDFWVFLTFATCHVPIYIHVICYLPFTCYLSH